MNDIKPPVISPERKQILIHEIIDYFATEKDIQIGIIAAEEILNFFLIMLNKEIYNQAIEDTQKVVRQGMEKTIVTIDSLVKL